LLKEPKLVRSIIITPDKGAMGKLFKKDCQTIVNIIDAMTEEEKAKLQS